MTSSLLYLSVLLPLLVKAQTDPEDGPVPNSSPIPTTAPSVNSQAGASGGSQGAYTLSRGGLIAIIVVVVVFAILGIGSAILFYVAKKRQWEIRKSIKRASRRITSRRNSVAQNTDRQSKRQGTISMSTQTRQKPRDVEKGYKKPVETTKEVKSERSAESQKVNAAAENKWKTILPESWSVGGKRKAEPSQGLLPSPR